jgi:hypothetical protein
VPPGYRLAEVAVAERAARTGGIEPNPPYRALLNPPSREVVSISYRRGFQQLIVTTRLREVGGQRWRDPFPPAETARPLGSEWITLAEGPLADAEVELVTGALTVPHLWGLAAGLVVTVSGDLGREELVDVAESLRPLGG